MLDIGAVPTVRYCSFSVRCWSCSDSMVFFFSVRYWSFSDSLVFVVILLDIGAVPTVQYLVFFC